MGNAKNKRKNINLDNIEHCLEDFHICIMWREREKHTPLKPFYTIEVNSFSFYFYKCNFINGLDGSLTNM